MDAQHFDAWTRRKFGLAAGNALVALFALGNVDEAGARRPRCLRQGRACSNTTKRCCRKLTCENTFVDEAWVDVCCKPDGESCTADSTCCLTNCDADTGKCKSCRGRVCDAEHPCCPYYECENGFCGGCAIEGAGCNANRPCCPGNGECTNGYCGGCVRSLPDGVTQCFRDGVPCCDTECTFFAPTNDVGFCVSEQGGPCARDVDCRTCFDNYPDQCDGACDTSTHTCTV